MKKLILILIALTFIMTQFSLSKKEKEKTKIEGRALTGASIVISDHESSKFFEYRDVPKGFSFGLFDMRMEKSDLYLNFTAKGIQQSDERYLVSLGKYGKFRVNFEWDKIPHRYSFEGRTLYNESEPGILFLSDQIQNELQNTIGDLGSNFGQGMDILSSYLTGAHNIDLGIIRKKGTLNFKYDLSEPVKFNLTFKREKKEGTRPIGAPLGWGNVMEVPEPIDQDTTQIEARLSYSKKKVNLNAGYYVSIFKNNILSLQWDNPYRLTDQATPSPLAYLNGNASSTGQSALSPSNTAQEVFFNGTMRILKKTRIHTSLAYGIFSQNENLLPYTVNSGLISMYTLASAPPRKSAEARVNSSSVKFTLSSRIIENVVLNAGYKYYNFINKTDGLSLPGYAVLDQVWTDTPLALEPLGYTRSSFYGTLSYNKIKNTIFNLGYKYKKIKREIGSEDNGATSDGTFTVSFNTNPFEWMSLRCSYFLSKRDWSLENKKDLFLLREEGSFNFRRYHEADRSRNGANFYMTISPLNSLDFSASFIMALDEYKKSEYGLKSNDFYSFSLDFNYRFANNSMYGFYSWERYSGFQGARETSKPPYDSISINPLDDWSNELTDTINTFGIGINLSLKKNKLNLDLSYTYSKANGSAELSIPAGNIKPVENFENGLDSSTIHIGKAKLIWKLNPNVSLIMGEWFEQYSQDDISRNDLQVDMLNEGFAFYLGALEPNFKYNVSYLQIQYSW